MKVFVKKTFVIIALIASLFTTLDIVAPNSAYADGEGRAFGSCDQFLGMVPWDCGLKEMDNEDALKENILLIATNVLNDLIIIATYLVLGYVIYGGYLYIFASGDVAKVANGKKTLIRAFIGLAIVMSAKAIISTIHIVFLGNNGAFVLNSGIKSNEVITNTINWFIGTAGVIALIYVVIGGIGYITSAGDSAKLQKSKNTIFYSLIGLIICAISLAATAFVSNMIREANKTSFINQTIISKEIHKK